MTPIERYHTDPNFTYLVRSFIRMFEQSTSSGAGYTPSEIREASGLAWQFYMEQHPSPLLIDRDAVRT